jgi:hypothetical protein
MPQKLSKSDKMNQNERLSILYVDLFCFFAASIIILIAMASAITSSLTPYVLILRLASV